ncbi:polysaccharide deacetylase family protein [Alkaliphilus sp. MSJ-5]|uniref:Polysaccharide deacetylase family protein n=1 Tax=Alkaliphilus flagellatus TaxID=2841507 RepID=A0ABS6G4P5_9FIRM|nr:polysaccharide deacetylase family protein [Alkaliphilus flagellatus]MBU5677468.1 polysaccharide deacetylase family protein [Alkaliphilus flagellatus]
MVIIINKKFARLVIAFILITLIITIGFVTLRRGNTEVFSNYNYTTVKPIDRGSEDSKYIAFTCNVDWGNEVLPDILETLDKEKIKITFFITGRWAKQFPDLMQQIVDAGHEIGSHGYQHLDYGSLALDKNEEQIQKADEILSKYTMEKISLFAPPSGSYNENTLIASNKLGYKTILWTIDTIDWRAGSTKDVIIDRVLKKDKFNGAIVLMHPMPETAKALPKLIEAMREKGLEVGRVSDVLAE